MQQNVAAEDGEYGGGERKEERSGGVQPFPSAMGWAATYIAPLQPRTLAAFPPWGIQRELAVQDCPCV